MLIKTILTAVAAVALIASPVMAEDLGFGWQEVNGSAGDGKNTSGKTDTKNFYQPVATQGRDNAEVHKTFDTNKNTRATLPTTAGSVLPGGGHICPGCLAGMVDGTGPGLPNTRLDSFVAQSGYNDMTYGDEGTDGPPPYDTFLTIGATRQLPTTGHSGGGLPSAWY